MRRSARKLLRIVGRGRTDSFETATRASSPPTEFAPGPPVSRYDRLSEAAVLAHLSSLAPKRLAELGDYERAHQNRVAVVSEIDARLGNEPWPGYDELDVDGVRFGLDGADRDRFVMVLAYERAHRNRAGVVLAAQQKPT